MERFDSVDPESDDFMKSYESRRMSPGITVDHQKKNILLEQVDEYKKSNNSKIYILTPLYGGVCQLSYVESLMSTVQLFSQLGLSLSIQFCKNDSLVTRARNNLIAKAMSDPETTHMMFIDGDISWNPVDVVKLMLSNKPLIGGIYPLKKYNFDKLLKSDEIQDIISKKEKSFLNHSITNEEIIRYNMVKYNVNYLSNTLQVQNNIAKVRHIPTGFMMINRKVIESMITASPSSKYVDDVGFLSGSQNDFAFALFDCKIEDGHYLSEDWFFCSQWNKLGGDVFIDVSINLTHTGSEEFKGSYMTSII